MSLYMHTCSHVGKTPQHSVLLRVDRFDTMDLIKGLVEPPLQDQALEFRLPCDVSADFSRSYVMADAFGQQNNNSISVLKSRIEHVRACQVLLEFGYAMCIPFEPSFPRWVLSDAGKLAIVPGHKLSLDAQHMLASPSTDDIALRYYSVLQLMLHLRSNGWSSRKGPRTLEDRAPLLPIQLVNQAGEDMPAIADGAMGPVMRNEALEASQHEDSDHMPPFDKVMYSSSIRMGKSYLLCLAQLDILRQQGAKVICHCCHCSYYKALLNGEIDGIIAVMAYRNIV